MRRWEIVQIDLIFQINSHGSFASNPFSHSPTSTPPGTMSQSSDVDYSYQPMTNSDILLEQDATKAEEEKAREASRREVERLYFWYNSLSDL